ncbi:charged multivesicular body protein 4b-like isoform X2 [Mugil cephalus]|uniref:charged multivesicular body protein 4b-like isoform X2 n=1 Tax=Mugil cephalus TaxID=48193 RepID=UPI001FB7F243|nr:charged multivesicular body protein 4b-like isoform X2 [Mugil cephalus]
MSVFKMLSEGENARKTSCYEEEFQKLPERRRFLMKKKEILKKKIKQELVLAKKNSTTNRTVALQALRRKKRHEKQLEYIDFAFKALRSAEEHIEIVNMVNELMEDIQEEQDVNEDASDSVYAFWCLEVEFDEDELLAELQRLEKSVDESLFETDKVDEPTASPPRPDGGRGD